MFDEERFSRIFWELFFLAIFTSFVVMAYTFLWKKDFPIFTDPDQVPEPTDFFTNLPDYV